MKVLSISRVMGRDEATLLVGETVTDHESSEAVEAVWYDDATEDPVLMYAPYRGDTTQLRSAVRGIQWNATTRASGMRNVSKIFGMKPRRPVLKSDGCQPSELMWDQPEIHLVLEEAGQHVQDEVESNLPDIAADDRKVLAEVAPDWRIGEDTIWTSGVVNLLSALPYHRDGNNFDTWSAMPVVRRGVRGGHLHIPEYDFTFPCRDGWVVYFKGYELVHGVTPLERYQADGYRISIVYYSLRGMKDCATFARELSRHQQTRTRREAAMLRGSPFDPS